MTLHGGESDAELAKLKALKPIMVLINVDSSKYVCVWVVGSGWVWSGLPSPLPCQCSAPSPPPPPNPPPPSPSPPYRLSRVHASRRIMEFIVAAGLTVPVIHHFTSPAVEKDQLILRAGSEARGLCFFGLRRSERQACTRADTPWSGRFAPPPTTAFHPTHPPNQLIRSIDVTRTTNVTGGLHAGGRPRRRRDD